MTKVCYNHIDGTPEKGLVNVPSRSERKHSCHPSTLCSQGPAMQNVIFTLSFLQQKGENALRNGSSVLPNAALRCIVLQ